LFSSKAFLSSSPETVRPLRFDDQALPDDLVGQVFLHLREGRARLLELADEQLAASELLLQLRQPAADLALVRLDALFLGGLAQQSLVDHLVDGLRAVALEEALDDLGLADRHVVDAHEHLVASDRSRGRGGGDERQDEAGGNRIHELYPLIVMLNSGI
jgi:hypothetical protein